MSELEWLDIFGDNLVSLLKDARMSQRELADAAGLSEATISSYIRKRKMPSIRAVVNIAYVFGISMDELIDFGDMVH